MIDGLVGGKLYGQPTQRTSKTGKPFAIAKVRAAAGDGESLFVNVIAFDDEPVAALLGLGDGDSVALAGSLTPKVWTDKDGNTRPSLDMVAHQVLSVYHITKKRKAMHQDPPTPGQYPKDEAWQARAPQDRSELDSDDAMDW